MSGPYHVWNLKGRRFVPNTHGVNSDPHSPILKFAVRADAEDWIAAQAFPEHFEIRPSAAGERTQE